MAEALGECGHEGARQPEAAAGSAKAAMMAQAKNGGMAAVIGLSADRIAAALAENGLTAIDIANYNSPSQTVISGPVDDITRAKAIMEAAGARMYVPLAVSAAFHSRYMADAAKAFDAFLAEFTFKPLQTPVISNVTAQPYPDGDPTIAIRSLLTQQIAQSVQWTQSVRYLLNAGATTFKEIGPGNVLTRLVKQIQQESA